MPTTRIEDHRKVEDPYNPKTGATGADDPKSQADDLNRDDEVETDGKELGG